MGLFSTLAMFIKGLVHVDISIEVESGDSFAVSADITLEMVNAITENEAEYVWSSFYNRVLHIDDLMFSHVDSAGIAGYRVAGTSVLVWRDQLYPVALA